MLLVAQVDLARWAIKHLNKLIALGQRLPHNLCEWARLSSYAMTDAHAYTQMMAGTNGAFFQMLGWDDDVIRRHLQDCDADRYVTRDAVAHAAGLFGHPLPPGTDLSSWWTIGGQYASNCQDLWMTALRSSKFDRLRLVVSRRVRRWTGTSGTRSTT
ncbi:hypothetical protein [Streptomyces sp. NBC_01198]|uniref:hypothetical protein n=1 Tax=Streptomyces sp. NBC_01198 TaxID=2903769 RepID=UPI002E0DAFDA|nr:hypothetical protein OG702_35075 [Streptomyces sp. NBC_01198]